MVTPRRSAAPLLAACLVTAPLAAQVGSADSALAARRADLAQFRMEAFTRDQSYTPDSRKQADERLARLEAALPGLTAVQFELELARIVALADNAHSVAAAPSRMTRTNRVPLRHTIFGASLHVVRAAGQHADLLGARLVAVDGHDAASLLAAARTLAGGPDNWRERNAALLVESPEQLHALGLARQPGRATYRYLLADGRQMERQVTAEPPGPAREASGPRGVLAPPAGPLPEGWQALLPADRAPWALMEPTTPFRSREAPELGALVIELRQTSDAPGQPIAAFLAAVVRELEARQPRHAIVDLRVNGGGNLNTTRDFMQRLPQLVPGRIFVLTSPWTFSAAISSLGYLEQAAPDRVTIVGEMVGDRLEFFAEGRPVTLSNSRAVIGIATERHDYQNGCRAFRDCHGPVARNPISVPTLAPDIAAPWTIEAYRAGRDPGMEAIIAAVRSIQP